MNGQDARIGPDYRAGAPARRSPPGDGFRPLRGEPIKPVKTRLPDPLGANRMERRNAACASAHKTITPAAGVPTRAALYPDLQIAADHMLPVRHAILPAPARNHPDAHQG